MQYTTILQEGSAEHIAERSRFIGAAVPVTTAQEAEELITAVRKKHYNATHNVFAYHLHGGAGKRYSDDGEPQGTAGLPILDMLEKQALCNLCVVVTRYFGGTLLGTGGLVRAYTAAAKLAVQNAGTVTMHYAAEIHMLIDYNAYGKLNYILPNYETVVLDADFGEKVELHLLMQEKYVQAFLKKVEESWNGTLTPTIQRWTYSPFL